MSQQAKSQLSANQFGVHLLQQQVCDGITVLINDLVALSGHWFLELIARLFQHLFDAVPGRVLAHFLLYLFDQLLADQAVGRGVESLVEVELERQLLKGLDIVGALLTARLVLILQADAQVGQSVLGLGAEFQLHADLLRLEVSYQHVNQFVGVGVHKVDALILQLVRQMAAQAVQDLLNVILQTDNYNN